MLYRRTVCFFLVVMVFGFNLEKVDRDPMELAQFFE